METGTVTSADGTEIFYRDMGGSGPAVLLIHGYMQNSLSWQFQLEDEALRAAARMIAIDLRGHGRSGKPEQADAYTKGQNWAADVAAVIDGLSLDKVVIVGWSYGGIVIADYLKHEGASRLAGIGMVGTLLTFNTEDMPTTGNRALGEALQHVGSTDADLSSKALDAFARGLVAKPLPESLHYEFMGYGAATCQPARQHMLARSLDYRPVAAGINLPVWAPHGDADAIVAFEAGRQLAAAFPHGELSVYEGVGHSPFAESPDRFNRELLDFVSRIS